MGFLILISDPKWHKHTLNQRPVYVGFSTAYETRHFGLETAIQHLDIYIRKRSFFSELAFQSQIRVEKNLYKLFTNFWEEEIEQDIEE